MYARTRCFQGAFGYSFRTRKERYCCYVYGRIGSRASVERVGHQVFGIWVLDQSGTIVD